MAGYLISTLDHIKFQQFYTDPSEEQMLALADIVSGELDGIADELEEEDVMSNWPAEPQELAPILRERILSDDWFSGLSEPEKVLFDYSLRTFFCEEKAGLGHQCNDEAVYWDVITMIRAFHGVPTDTVNEKVISKFGAEPFRAHIEPGKKRGWETWAPYHSIHLPEDVRKLRDEVLAAQTAVMDSDDEDAKEQYEDELVPALDRAIEQNRVLLIEVDT